MATPSLCNYANLSYPDIPDILEAIVAALEALHLWPPPPFQPIPIPQPFCPLD